MAGRGPAFDWRVVMHTDVERRWFEGRHTAPDPHPFGRSQGAARLQAPALLRLVPASEDRLTTSFGSVTTTCLATLCIGAAAPLTVHGP
jgi:hypothetical protein